MVINIYRTYIARVNKNSENLTSKFNCRTTNHEFISNIQMSICIIFLLLTYRCPFTVFSNINFESYLLYLVILSKKLIH